MKLLVTLHVLLCFLCGINATAQIVPDYNPSGTMTPEQLAAYRQSIWDTLPAAIGWVNDFEGLFSLEEEDSIESRISHFEKLTGVEIAIVTVDSNMVAADKLNEFSYRLLKKWGIGKISESNGIVICISRESRRIYITTDFGINKYFDEAEKYRIINKYIIPLYKKNDYFGGTLSGLNNILERIRKKWERPGRSASI